MRIGKTILLSVLIVALLIGGIALFSKYRATKTEYESSLADAENEVAVLRGDVPVPPEMAAEIQRAGEKAAEEKRAELIASAIADADAESAALEEENASIDGQIGEIEKDVSEKMKDEQNIYFQQIYDSYTKGMEQVDGYIKGN